MRNPLRVTTPGDREIVMTRAFDAPRHLVFQALTKPELIRRWLFLPPGWAMTACQEDLRVGGSFRWEWAGPEGQTAMVMHGVYREVIPPRRIVRTETLELVCDAQKCEQLATFVLTEQAGKTTVTITVLYPSKEARDGALASGMERGVAASYDRLEELLESAAAEER